MKHVFSAADQNPHHSLRAIQLFEAKMLASQKFSVDSGQLQLQGISLPTATGNSGVFSTQTVILFSDTLPPSGKTLENFRFQAALVAKVFKSEEYEEKSESK